jgi:hypothetical protein
MEKPNDIKITVCSDLDYDHLIAEIYIADRFVALISQEEGKENLKIEFPRVGMTENAICEKAGLVQFMEAVEIARRRLVDR